MFAKRSRILHYPALVNCTSIDWFCEWPKDALLEVAERYLDGLELGSAAGVREHTHCKHLRSEAQSFTLGMHNLCSPRFISTPEGREGKDEH